MSKKIDVSKINGYDSMTVEDKLNALLNYEFAEEPAQSNNSEMDKLKAALSKSNSEAAEYKRQLKAKMTEAEQAEAARSEAEQQMRDELAQLRKERTLSGYKSRLMETGYDAETASKMAEKMPEGISDEFFSMQKEFLENRTKTIQAELLNKQPEITPGKAPTKDMIEDGMTAAFRRAAGLN